MQAYCSFQPLEFAVVSTELEMLVREVQRLTSELELVRERHDAYERSRWMRIHPRFLLRRALPRRSTAAAPPPPEPRDDRLTDELVQHFRKEVIEPGSFSQDGFTLSMRAWEPLFEQLEGKKARMLEVGSYEGMSACYALWRLPDAHITCVDTFAGSPEDAVLDIDLSTLGAVFERNIALVDASRVRTLVGDSRRMLLELVEAEESFDLVYIDGSHLALDVLVDTAYAWQLVRKDGFLVWDDYEWAGLGLDPVLRPGVAIDAFLSLIDGKYELLRKRMQVVIRKTDV